MKLRYIVRKTNGTLVSDHTSSTANFHEYYLPSLGQDETLLVVVYFEDTEIGRFLLKR